MPLTINALPLAALVKDATQQCHAAVEEILLPQLSSLQRREEYAALLHMFYGYYYPLEESIARQLTSRQLPDIAERRKADSILTDLKAIGQPTDNQLFCRNLPTVQSCAQAFGALYVLEGSTLGGTYITKMLLQNKNLSLPPEAVSFFAGYRGQTGTKWKTFLEVFNRQTDADTVIKSANDTFNHLKSWMQQSLSL